MVISHVLSLLYMEALNHTSYCRPRVIFPVVQQRCHSRPAAVAVEAGAGAGAAAAQVLSESIQFVVGSVSRGAITARPCATWAPGQNADLHAAFLLIPSLLSSLCMCGVGRRGLVCACGAVCMRVCVCVCAEVLWNVCVFGAWLGCGE